MTTMIVPPALPVVTYREADGTVIARIDVGHVRWTALRIHGRSRITYTQSKPYLYPREWSSWFIPRKDVPPSLRRELLRALRAFGRMRQDGT